MRSHNLMESNEVMALYGKALRRTFAITVCWLTDLAAGDATGGSRLKPKNPQKTANVLCSFGLIVV